MSGPFRSGIGIVLSADIAVPEHERELHFYKRVLCTGERPLWRDDLMNNLGVPVIGLGERSAEYASLPLQWMPHIQVADVVASAARAAERGGAELLRGSCEGGASQWAVLRDPNGAAFGVISVVPPEAIPKTDGETVGRIGWLDLTVPDAAATRDFYAAVVGWKVQEVEMEDGEARYADYNLLGADRQPAAGVCHARGPNAYLPPVWMLYLLVADATESVRRVEVEGGQVLNSVTGEDGRVQFAAIRDPVGAALMLYQA